MLVHSAAIALSTNGKGTYEITDRVAAAITESRSGEWHRYRVR